MYDDNEWRPPPRITNAAHQPDNDPRAGARVVVLINAIFSAMIVSRTFMICVTTPYWHLSLFVIIIIYYYYYFVVLISVAVVVGGVSVYLFTYFAIVIVFVVACGVSFVCLFILFLL